MEKIQVSKSNPAFHFLVEAIARTEPEIDTAKIRKTQKIEVCCMVEGVEIPFEQTIVVVYELFRDDINQTAAKMAYDFFRLEGLKKINETLDRLDWQVREKIQEIFGVDIE